MLEPLIVLTVLNCFFMFSSTVTTCALWWQYRSHKCCFKKDPMHHITKQTLSKLKNNYSSKKTCNPKHDSPVNATKLTNHEGSKSNTTISTTANRDCKKKRNSKQKVRSSLKHSHENRTPSELSSTGMENWDVDDRTRMSEASQTGNDAKSAVVMEYSTVQKIVQILDDDTDLVATKLAIKDWTNKQCDEKKIEHVGEPKFENSPISPFAPTTPN